MSRAIKTGGTLAVIVAAGRGRRLNSPVPKQYLRLSGRSVISYSLELFLQSPKIDGVLVVIADGDQSHYQQSLGDGADTINHPRLLPPVLGGAERQDSVRLGLASLQEFSPRWVVIHDAARPLLTAESLDQILMAVDDDTPSAIAALAMTDSVKLVSPDPRRSDILSQGNLDRKRLWRALTPQVFDYDKLWQLHQKAGSHHHSDDAALFEAAGLAVRLVPSDARNFKITTAEDLTMAEALLSSPQKETRVASGFDVHEFTAGDQVILGGVAIPHSHRLAGHSDADVGLHALTDALLGTIAAGDIGSHFPPSDPKWKGADSAQFLAHAASLLRAKGGEIVLVDLTLICEAPKIGPHRVAMTERIAEILGIAPDRVSVKATTTEGLGFTGRREGIAAMATATVRV
ncbi:MAG: bifunctional 2-C-methyl-D-erythritol 4-phosphate cytidylyltransferase/2-C-methyl-D-erythritol 2,4-cyclodiphosphate synthase [Candidatus Pacebacteria bacterium]|nr:bifunctional 2-C-methyl-D-erythritol 4-phosphate cytidylyltransferase/2-C-methyl-D-erythritol 2,4-cyclodiphosphate synthase [Candidatus Paceibacterota bacterium]